MNPRLYKLHAGCYVHDNEYCVERFVSGWRWWSVADASTGGEWRSTKGEAVQDLAEYLQNRQKPQ
jgi:hypothetical protein